MTCSLRRWAAAVTSVVLLSGCSGSGASTLGASATPGHSGLSPEEQVAKDVGFTGDVTPVREVSPDEQFLLLERCLRDQGWSVALQGDGSLRVEIATEQEEAYDHAKARCLLRYPLAERYVRPWGAREHGLVYDHWRDVTIPCLTDNGYHHEPLPAREVYVEGQLAGTPSYFLNRDVDEQILSDVRSGRWTSLQDFWTTVCPYDPPDELLYGPEE